MKNLKKLAALMMNEENGRYNESFKERFRSVGIRAMKELAQILELKEYKINFNPGGIAVSGDLRLMGMWSEGNGIYVSMNKDFPEWGKVVYRNIKHMEDYVGGSNNYFEFKLLASPERLRNKLLALRKGYHELVVESLCNGKAYCTCGRWIFARPLRVSRGEVEDMFKKHISSLSPGEKAKLEVRLN